MSNINRPVIYAAEKGIVIAECSGKRGKVLTTIKLASGREIKVSGRFEFADVERFADPVAFSELVKDYRRDNLNRRRVMGIA